MMRKAHSVARHNYRKLDLEHQVLLSVHALSVVLCFFPWFSAEPLGVKPFYYNAFFGETFLIGALIFMVSLVVVLLFLDQLMDRNRIQFPVDRNYIFLGISFQQILLAVLAWSVLLRVGAGYYASSSLRFGLALLILAQIVGTVAVYLHIQKSKQKKARSFFQHPKVSSARGGEDSQE